MGKILKVGDQLVDVEASLLDIDRFDCEENLYRFLRGAWRNIDASPFTSGWPIEAVAEHLEAVADGEIRRLIVNIPPRCAKSSLTSVAFPAWVWAQRKRGATSGPGVRFMHASYAQQLALRDSVKTRRLIESPWYQKRWGERFKLTNDQNTKTRFDNDAKGSRLSTSVGSALTGEGGDIIVVDDPNNAQEAFSDATIASTIEWWDSALSTRLNDPKTGAFIVIQQRLSEEDLTGHILSKNMGDWCHLCLPMRYEPERSFMSPIGWLDPRQEPGELLWPDRFGEAEVKALENQMGPWAAAGQLQQRPEPKGGGIVKREWWQLWEAPSYPPLDFVVASLDTAYTTKSENDPSAMTVWGVFSGAQASSVSNYTDRTGRFVATGEQSALFDDAAQVQFVQASLTGSDSPKAILMNAWAERLELHELVKKVAATCRAMKVDTLLIENKASGHSVAQEIRRLYSHENWTVQLVDPKSQDKLSRLYSVQHLFAEGMIYAPDRQWADMVITQVGTFPKAKHDDLVDTVSQSLRFLRTTGMLTRHEEWTAEAHLSMQHQGKQLPPLYDV
jgi:predicted phage terminase large subunit-like protein